MPFDVTFYKYLRKLLAKTRNRKWLLHQLIASLTTPIKYAGKIFKCFSSVWYVILLLLLGVNMSTGALFHTKCPKQLDLVWPFHNIVVSAHPMAAFSGFYESHEPPPSGYVHGIVPPHHDGHQNGQKSGYMFHNCWVDCCPGGCLGNMEQVVAQWRRPVASGEALVMLHQVMCSVLHRRTAMVIELFATAAYFDWCNHS